MNAKARQTMEDKTSPRRWEYWIVAVASPAELPLSRPLVRMHIRARGCVFAWHPPKPPCFAAHTTETLGMRMCKRQLARQMRRQWVVLIMPDDGSYERLTSRRQRRCLPKWHTVCNLSGTHPAIANIRERRVPLRVPYVYPIYRTHYCQYLHKKKITWRFETWYQQKTKDKYRWGSLSQAGPTPFVQNSPQPKNFFLSSNYRYTCLLH